MHLRLQVRMGSNGTAREEMQVQQKQEKATAAKINMETLEWQIVCVANTGYQILHFAFLGKGLWKTLYNTFPGQ